LCSDEAWWTGDEDESWSLVDTWLEVGEEVAVEERVVLVRGGGVMNSQPWFCVWKSAVCVPLGGVILARLDCILAIIAII
jgi:hypothetical protein